MKQIKLAVFLALITATAAFAANSQKGTSTAIFLKMIPGARPAAMGTAFAGISNDVNAIYTNASGLASLIHPEISATHIKWLEDINNTYISAVYPYKTSAFGIGINYLSMGDVEMRDDTGALLSDKSSVFNASVYLAYAKKFNNYLFGLTAKQVIQRLGIYDGNGLAFDLSSLYEFGNFSVGVAAQNLGSKIQIAGVGNNLPFLIRAGVGFTPIDKLLVGIDLEMPRDDDMKTHIGGEYALRDNFILRAGYNQIDGGLGKFNSAQGWSLGLGSKTFLGQRAIYGGEETDTENLNELVFDYALAKFSDDLGFTHRFTISVKFK